jgi:hypothetical protein
MCFSTETGARTSAAQITELDRPCFGQAEAVPRDAAALPGSGALDNARAAGVFTVGWFAATGFRGY